MQNGHSPFLLYQRDKEKRKKAGKKAFYYCQYRLASGKLSNPFSTGCTSRTQAFTYVQKLIDRGEIKCGEDYTFHSFARNFYDFGSVWVKDKLSLGTEDKPAISERQIKKYQGFVRHYFLRYIPNKLVSAFTPTDIKEFRTCLLEQSDLSRKTINDIMSCLRIMLTSALNDGIIARNPFLGIHPLVTAPHPRDAFPLETVKRIVGYDWNDEQVRTFMLTAALTGMRLSEINAIRRQNLNPTFIDLRDQFCHGKLRPLKTREARKIPLCEKLFTLLETMIPYGMDFVFDELPETRASDALREMLTKTMPEVRKAHGYCFHSLRHFACTFYLSENIAPVKVAAMLGHSTGVSSMQERYTNFTEENYKEIYTVQEKLFDYLTA